MSVTIHWKPANKQEKHFSGGTSSSLRALKETFGDEIGAHDVPTLRAMAKAANDKFYDEVANTVEQIGAITFWGEY